MTVSERRKRLREILARPSCITPASVFDPLSARIADELDFELGMFAGSTASLAVLAAPDLALLSLTEFAEQARRICRASDIPLLVDADHGYGNALNVARTVSELEASGVAGLTIEDTELPIAFLGNGAARLTSRGECIGKLKAALAAREDENLVIVARTTPSASDMADIIERVSAYEALGVDAIFFSGEVSSAQLAKLAAIATLPIILGNAGTGPVDRNQMAAIGVRICLQGHMPILAAVQAIYHTMKSLKEGAEPRSLDNIAPPDLMRRITNASAYGDQIKEFLGENR